MQKVCDDECDDECEHTFYLRTGGIYQDSLLTDVRTIALHMFDMLDFFVLKHNLIFIHKREFRSFFYAGLINEARSIPVL